MFIANFSSFTLGVDDKHVQVLEGGRASDPAFALSADYELTVMTLITLTLKPSFFELHMD